MRLKEASDIAEKLVDKLSPLCDIINITGSIRRQKPEVKDIELVILPKTVQYEGGDLFNKEILTRRLPEFEIVVRSLGEIIKGKPDGKYMQIKLPDGVNLDLFMPDDFDYYRIYCIRTGSAEWVQRYIAGGWRKIGFVGSDKGLRKMSDCEKIKSPGQKDKWRCVNVNGELPPYFKSEMAFFEWLQIPYTEPKLRK